jgi:hypothetical protein
MCNPSFLVVFLGGIGKKEKELNLDMRNDFLQGHILSTTGADLLVVDCVCVCVCVISKEASKQ